MEERLQQKSPGVTLRALAIGCILIPPNCYWVAQSEAVWGTIYLTIVSLFFNVHVHPISPCWTQRLDQAIRAKGRIKARRIAYHLRDAMLGV